jgi:hypothetical protein
MKIPDPFVLRREASRLRGQYLVRAVARAAIKWRVQKESPPCPAPAPKLLPDSPAMPSAS